MTPLEQIKETLAHFQGGRFDVIGGPYSDEKMRGPNVEKVELINKYSVLNLLASLKEESK